MSPQNSTGSTRDSDSCASSQSCDSQVLSDDGRSRNPKCRGAGGLPLGCSDVSSSLCTAWAQQTKRRKQLAKKLILDQDMDQRPASTRVVKQERTEPGKSQLGTGVEFDSYLQKEELHSQFLLEQYAKEGGKDWIHGVQAAVEQAPGALAPEEQNLHAEERIGPACWGTVEQSSEEEQSRDGSQITGK